MPAYQYLHASLSICLNILSLTTIPTGHAGDARRVGRIEAHGARDLGAYYIYIYIYVCINIYIHNHYHIM